MQEPASDQLLEHLHLTLPPLLRCGVTAGPLHQDWGQLWLGAAAAPSQGSARSWQRRDRAGPEAGARGTATPVQCLLCCNKAAGWVEDFTKTAEMLHPAETGALRSISAAGLLAGCPIDGTPLPPRPPHCLGGALAPAVVQLASPQGGEA